MAHLKLVKPRSLLTSMINAVKLMPHQYVPVLIKEHRESLTNFSWDGVGSKCLSTQLHHCVL